MDEMQMLRGRLRRGPWNGGDLNDVFRQLDSIQTVPGGVAQDLGSTPEETRRTSSYVRNGDFAALPPDPTGAINDITNKLPDWNLVTVQGSSITVAAVADASAATGYVIRFTCASGNAGDEVYLEQEAPIASNRKGSWAAYVNAFFLAASVATANLTTKVSAQYLKGDGTATGSENTVTTNFATSDTEPTAKPDTTGTVPGDALLLRIRIGVRRATTSATTGYRDLCDVFMNTGGDTVLVADEDDPTAGPAEIFKTSDRLIIRPSSASRPAIQLDDVSYIQYSDPFGARAVRSSAQNFATGVSESVGFNATDAFDPLAMHSTSTNNDRITVPEAGYYLVGGGIEWASNSTGYRQCWIEVNGIDGGGTALMPMSKGAPAPSGRTAQVAGPCYVHLDADDYVALTGEQNSGGGLDVEQATLWVRLMEAD